MHGNGVSCFVKLWFLPVNERLTIHCAVYSFGFTLGFVPYAIFIYSIFRKYLKKVKSGKHKKIKGIQAGMIKKVLLFII